MELKHVTHFRTLRRLLAMAQKETYHIIRDTRALILAFLMPVILIILFGYAVSFDTESIPIVSVDYDNTALSRKLVQELSAGREFEIQAQLFGEKNLFNYFLENKTLSAIVIPKGFAQKLAQGTSPTVQLLVDGSNGSTATAIMMSASGILEKFTRSPSTPTLAPPVTVKVQMQYNPGLKSALFVVPGLVAYILALAAVLLTSLTIAREWERGNMEQLFATPIGSFEIVLGKLLPYLFIGIMQSLFVITIGTTVFSIPLNGSFLLLFVAIIAFIFCMLGQGLFISVVAKNQQIATLVSAVTTILPSLILSGFLFPIANMPKILQYISLILPARYFMEIIRGVFLKGMFFADLWQQFLGLAIFGVFIVTVATKKFKRKIA